MLYLSQMIGRSVYSREKEPIAVTKDIVVSYGEEEYPKVIGLVARYRRRLFFVAQSRIREIDDGGARMNTSILDLTPFARRKGEILLGRDVLDKQLIDVDGKRVVRINDVQLFGSGNNWRVSGADISLRGFVRRLLPIGWFRRNRPVEVIDWKDVGYLATDTKTVTVQLKSSKDKLSRLHPVEIAQLAEALSPIHRTDIVESLDDQIAAETLEEMSTENQARVLEDLDVERAADLLEEMSPDDAVDVLDQLDDEKAKELFDLMEDKEKEDVAELMQHDSDTAGGLMTTEFVSLEKEITIAQAIGRIRKLAETPKMVYYLYIVGGTSSRKLIGITTLRNLILADSESKIEDIMRTDFQFSNPDQPAAEVAMKIAEYNLLALPVLDEMGDMLGIVTVDDAMEILLPKRFD